MEFIGKSDEKKKNRLTREIFDAKVKPVSFRGNPFSCVNKRIGAFMERNSSFLQKLKARLIPFFCLALAVCIGIVLGEKTQKREACAARCVEFTAAYTGKDGNEKGKWETVPAAKWSENAEYAARQLEEETTGVLLGTAACKIANGAEPRKVRFEEITTVALAKMAMEAVEQETLELMSSPAGTAYGTMIKAYAGKTPILISEDDKEVLLRIVEAEATSEDVKGRMLVANVVLNRVLCDGFPDTIAEVVFQKNGDVYQFSPVKDKRYWQVEVSDKTREAVERVLAGEDESQGALFFMARSMANPKSARWFDEALQYLFKYGVHEFYKNK